MKFFIDANLPARVARALAQLEPSWTIRCPADLRSPENPRPEDERDEDFLPRMEDEGGWVVLTRDTGSKDGNWHVWMECSLTVFFLRGAWNGAEFYDMTARILSYWKGIEREARRRPQGSKLWLRYRGGAIEVVKTSQRQRKRKRR